MAGVTAILRMHKLTMRSFAGLNTLMVSARKLPPAILRLEGGCKRSLTAIWIPMIPSYIRNYQGLTELSASVVNSLIDKILVSERETLSDGTVQQEIKIYYKFIGFVGELHIRRPSGGQHCQRSIVRRVAQDLSPALRWLCTAPLAGKGYGCSNPMKASAGAGSEADGYVLNCPQKMTD